MVDRHAANHTRSVSRWTSLGLAVALATSAAGVQARASGPDETVMDASALSQLEQRADTAKPQERCFLYAEVLHSLTETAGRAMAAGDEATVTASMVRIDAVMHKIEASSGANAKRLKNAEELLEHTQHRLADMAHAASNDEHDAVQSALQHIDKVHASLLALVFAK
jgi:hypothetical protein